MKKRFLVAGVFLLGGMAGYSLAMIRQGLDKLPANRDAVVLQSGVNKLEAKLKLTPVQKRSIHKILRHRRKDVAHLKKEFRPKYLAIRKDLEHDIHAVLTPEQRASFDALSRQAEQREGWLKDTVLTSAEQSGECGQQGCLKAPETQTETDSATETAEESPQPTDTKS